MGRAQTTGIITKTETIQIPGGPSLVFTRVDNVDSLINAAEDIDELPFWAELWPSAIGLASYLWQELDLRDKAVLELGAGLGLAGIGAAKKGALVTQTDFIQEALNMAATNGEANHVSNRLLLADWRNFPEIGTFPVIAGSDILYEPELHHHLETLILKHLEPGGSLILSDPGRDHARNFLLRFKPPGWDLQLTQIPVELDGKTYNIRIYHLVRLERWEE